MTAAQTLQLNGHRLSLMHRGRWFKFTYANREYSFKAVCGDEQVVFPEEGRDGREKLLVRTVRTPEILTLKPQSAVVEDNGDRWQVVERPRHGSLAAPFVELMLAKVSVKDTDEA